MMNDLLAKTTPAAANAGSGVAPRLAGASPPIPAPTAPARMDAGKPASGVGEITIGKPGYKFRHPVDSPLGQDERREHERIRKSHIRAAQPKSEPPALNPVGMVDAAQAAVPGEAAGLGMPSAEVVVAWTPDDVAEFTDELVELSEAKRVSDFVAIARKANLPPKFIAELEKDSGYGPKTKATLKRSVAACGAKWLNKSGMSARNKEEGAVLLCLITIKIQGRRLASDLDETIKSEAKKREEQTPNTKHQTPKDGGLV